MPEYYLIHGFNFYNINCQFNILELIIYSVVNYEPESILMELEQMVDDNPEYELSLDRLSDQVFSNINKFTTIAETLNMLVTNNYCLLDAYPLDKNSTCLVFTKLNTYHTS